MMNLGDLAIEAKGMIEEEMTNRWIIPAGDIKKKEDLGEMRVKPNVDDLQAVAGTMIATKMNVVSDTGMKNVEGHPRSVVMTKSWKKEVRCMILSFVMKHVTR